MKWCVFPQLCPDTCALGKGEGREKARKARDCEGRISQMDVDSLLGRDETEATGLGCERQRQRYWGHSVLESMLERTWERGRSGQGAVIPQWDD